MDNQEKLATYDEEDKQNKNNTICVDSTIRKQTQIT